MPAQYISNRNTKINEGKLHQKSFERAKQCRGCTITESTSSLIAQVGTFALTRALSRRISIADDHKALSAFDDVGNKK